MKMISEIEGFEEFTDYGITSCGKVWSFKRNKFLKPTKTNSGYLKVVLCKDGKRKDFLIHRLVALAYIPNPQNLDTVNHIDECKTHNYVNNLQWMTCRDNKTYSSGKPVRCVETGQTFDSIREAARQLNLYYSGVQAVCRGEYKTFHGYHFEFI